MDSLVHFCLLIIYHEIMRLFVSMQYACIAECARIKVSLICSDVIQEVQKSVSGESRKDWPDRAGYITIRNTDPVPMSSIGFYNREIPPCNKAKAKQVISKNVTSWREDRLWK
jgi:hypothetical protein